MTKTLPTIVFFGNEQLATGINCTAPVLTALIKAGYQVAAVVLSQKPVHGKTRTSQKASAVEKRAHEYGIPVYNPEKVGHIADELAAYKADAGVLVAYGKIVPESIIELFPSGIINIHPSLLPLYRGSSPIEGALLSGASKTGVSLMALAKKMDAGGIYGQVAFKLEPYATKQAVYDEVVAKATPLLLTLLPKIVSGERQPTPQNEKNATYTPRLNKQNAVINWDQPATQIERKIRAYTGWPGSKSTLKSVDVTITKARAVGCLDSANKKRLAPGEIVMPEATPELYIACLDGFLAVERLKPAGKSEMDVASFINGYAQCLGV